MRHLYIIMHQTEKGQFYTSFQNTDGEILAESRYDTSENSCSKTQAEILSLLKQRYRDGGFATPYICASYYYCCLKTRNEILLRTRTSATKEGSEEIWAELMACIGEGTYHFSNHIGEMDKLSLPLDPAVMNYMYSLDGQGRENILNYALDVQWEDPASWLWDGENKRMRQLYGKLFHRMPRSHEKEYRIEICTGDMPYADTNAAVYITLNGDKAVSQEFCLESTKENFRAGGRDVFVVTAQEDLGELTSLRIRHDNSGECPEWFLRNIRVKKEGWPRSWYFPCNQWMYVQQGEYKNDLTLQPGSAPSCEDHYTLRIRTGSVAVDSGTDANVYITLHGTKGNSQEYKLKSLLAHFDKGSDDTIDLIVTKSLGNLERLTIRHDNSGPCPSWYLRDVQVENKTTGGSWSFPCERWLAVDKDEKRTKWTLVAAPSGENEFVYAVRVQTGSKSLAGTDAMVFITLHGTKGSSQAYHLSNSGNDFEKGKLDTFRLCMNEDLGELTQVRIRHNNQGAASGWYLDHIEVDDLSVSGRWYVPCGRWLDKQKDDGAIDRTLEVLPAGQKEVRYRISVRTGNVSNAGTDAKVFITLHGKSGSSPEYRLEGAGNDFEKGKKDLFTITVARDLGELQSIRVRHNNGGLFPGWYLEDVSVELVDTDRSWYFPCGRWLDKKKDDGSIDRTLAVQAGGAKA